MKSDIDSDLREADRRFLRRLLIIAGPAFVGGGFLAAFSLVGALLIFTGLGMLAAGLLLFTRLPVALSALSGIAVAVALTVWMAIDLG